MTKIEVAAVTLIFYNIILCILCQCLGACPLDELLTCQTKSKPISLLFFCCCTEQFTHQLKQEQ